MLAATSWSPEGAGVLSSLARLLARAARRDPHLSRVTGGSVESHCHGYGYVLLELEGAPWRVTYERFDAAGLLKGPSGERGCRENLDALEEAVRRLAGRLSGSSAAYLVLHARRAGRGEPRGSANTHPFHAVYTTTQGPGEVFLAHNGSVEKELAAREAGVDPGASSRYTDSHLLALAVARRLSRGEQPGDVLAGLWRYAGGGYNVALLTLGSEGPGLWLAAGASSSILGDEARLGYYQPVLIAGEGVAGFASSTVAELALEESLPLEAKRLEPREWGVYRVEPGGGLPRLWLACPEGRC